MMVRMASRMLRFLKVAKNRYVDRPMFLMSLKEVQRVMLSSWRLKPQQGQN